MVGLAVAALVSTGACRAGRGSAADGALRDAPGGIAPKDVVVSGDRTFLFYFTHPGRRGADERKDGPEQRRSSIQVVELELRDGRLTADRDRPTRVRLVPP